MKFDIRVILGLICTIVIISALVLLSFQDSRYLYNSSLLRISVIGLALVCACLIIYLFIHINSALKIHNRAAGLLRQKVSSTRHNLEAKVEDRNRKLAETDYVYRSLAANIPGTAITILDREERYLLAEGDLLPKMGYNKDIMPGRKISEIITPKNYEYYEGLIHRAFDGETILVERQTLSGYYTLMKVVPLKKEDGFIFAIMFVLIDVTVIKDAQYELQRLNNELEARVAKRTEQLSDLNKELESFTYSVSHDLRAPLRAISSYAQILKEDYATLMDDEGKRVSDLVISNALRMAKLIEDLLIFARMGRQELSTAEINMEVLVNEVLKELTPEEGTRKLTIRNLPLPPASGDINMMRQVWVNLISNAIKYTRKKEFAEIEIGAYQENGENFYYVKDNGAGFDMEYSNKLFGVFQRLHKMSEFEGTGVGLALVKTIIRKHGGIIQAEAKVNEGAKFYFTLPNRRD